MKNKKPKKFIDKILPFWNLFLSVFSIIGSIRMVPYIFDTLSQKGLDCLLCTPPSYTYGRGPSGLWTGLFIYSKYIELFDTAFLILRKKPVPFLHWYHHATVLAFTWDAYAREMPSGAIFATINYLVHSVMYFYYFLTSLKYKPKWGITITIAQIVQMWIVLYNKLSFKLDHL
ncbi:putative fatty acid elongase 3 [Dermatophagoides farinae]|uniref:putative fatty acid elongase 3 n=1 Tax=Dermatophagoides farinae TaxID=6954 RepID=UPI003F638148